MTLRERFVFVPVTPPPGLCCFARCLIVARRRAGVEFSDVVCLAALRLHTLGDVALENRDDKIGPLLQDELPYSHVPTSRTLPAKRQESGGTVQDRHVTLCGRRQTTLRRTWPEVSFSPLRNRARATAHKVRGQGKSTAREPGRPSASDCNRAQACVALRTTHLAALLFESTQAQNTAREASVTGEKGTRARADSTLRAPLSAAHTLSAALRRRARRGRVHTRAPWTRCCLEQLGREELVSTKFRQNRRGICEKLRKRTRTRAFPLEKRLERHVPPLPTLVSHRSKRRPAQPVPPP